jgi:hypothetical protein
MATLPPLRTRRTVVLRQRGIEVSLFIVVTGKYREWLEGKSRKEVYRALIYRPGGAAKDVESDIEGFCVMIAEGLKRLGSNTADASETRGQYFRRVEEAK